MTKDISSHESGLDYLRRAIREKTWGAMGETMSITVEDAGDGFAVARGLPHERYYNSMMRLHGGYAATLLDTVLGCAVMSKLNPLRPYGTIELKVNYVRKIEVSTGPLIARANVIHAGRTMLTAEAKVADGDGVIYAHGTGTFLVYPS